MYDWIPMEFKFEYNNLDGTFTDYWCVANDESRTSFDVRHINDTVSCNGWYEVECLIRALEEGSTINGMSMYELQKALEMAESSSTIDISGML